jgi:hypothetical protein
MVTRVILVGTLAVTLLAVADVLRRDELSARTTASYLLLFSLLFVLRVVGQVFVALKAPAWLPPMEQWNLMPYRLLLPIQIVFVAVLFAIAAGVGRGDGFLAEQHPSFGAFLIGLGAVYAGSMAARYAVRMRRRPEERWFGGAIPIVFHVVLAGFLVTWGSYYVQG